MITFGNGLQREQYETIKNQCADAIQSLRFHRKRYRFWALLQNKICTVLKLLLMFRTKCVSEFEMEWEELSGSEWIINGKTVYTLNSCLIISNFKNLLHFSVIIIARKDYLKRMVNLRI